MPETNRMREYACRLGLSFMYTYFPRLFLAHTLYSHTLFSSSIICDAHFAGIDANAQETGPNSPTCNRKRLFPREPPVYIYTHVVYARTRVITAFTTLRNARLWRRPCVLRTNTIYITAAGISKTENHCITNRAAFFMRPKVRNKKKKKNCGKCCKSSSFDCIKRVAEISDY